ncbi:MAG: hypothetical protein DMG19_15580 [Acidobacteria bacterium]|nr:MAG: hypothetical protein DMG19_15580 [Acidobacteriota bacterium]
MAPSCIVLLFRARPSGFRQSDLARMTSVSGHSGARLMNASDIWEVIRRFTTASFFEKHFSDYATYQPLVKVKSNPFNAQNWRSSGVNVVTS